jgi:protein required for attachment to host cells
MPTTWILVADRTRARLFSTSRAEQPLDELRDFLNPEGHEHVQELAEAFARELCAALDRGLVDHACERVALVAPPEFLGMLHGCASKRVREATMFELDKSLTTRAPADIRTYLPMQLWHQLAG